MAKMLNNKEFATVKLYDKDGVAISTTNRLPVEIDQLNVTIEGGTFSSDLDHIQGTDVDVNSGNKSAGTQRMCLATDDVPSKLTNDSIGATDDALVDAGAVGSLSAKTRRVTTDLGAIKLKTDNIPAQGQALAAASLPVVLPATQITTLTPRQQLRTLPTRPGGTSQRLKQILIISRHRDRPLQPPVFRLFCQPHR